MLTFYVIGPGQHGNYLTGHIRPGTRVFVPLVDCNTREQAEDAKRELERQAVLRDRACYPPTSDDWRPVRGFYDDD